MSNGPYIPTNDSPSAQAHAHACNIAYATGAASRDDEIRRLRGQVLVLRAACEALPTFDIEQPDASDFKDHAGQFVNAMMLARRALESTKEQQ